MLNVIGENVGVCWGTSTCFFPPCRSEGAENIRVMLRLKTEGGKAAEKAGKREEEGIGMEV